MVVAPKSYVQAAVLYRFRNSVRNRPLAVSGRIFVTPCFDWLYGDSVRNRPRWFLEESVIGEGGYPQWVGFFALSGGCLATERWPFRHRKVAILRRGVGDF